MWWYQIVWAVDAGGSGYCSGFFDPQNRCLGYVSNILVSEVFGRINTTEAAAQ